MAAVTQTGTPTRHVAGDCVFRVFNFTGSSGDTLDTGLQQILFVGLSAGSLITAVVIAGGLLTLTSSAPMTAETLFVLARVG